jgi:peptidoglycan-N-acetylglucosamine deacetylase
MDPDPASSPIPLKRVIRFFIIATVFISCNEHKSNTAQPISEDGIDLRDTETKTAPLKSDKKKTKTIYLTFDDGPNKGTKNLLHIIEQEQVPVTAFIIGEQVKGSAAQTDLFDSIANNRYFEIANHSFTHAFHNKFVRFYNVPINVIKDFERCTDSFHLTDKIIRLPGRNVWRTATVSGTDIQRSKPAADSLFSNGFTEVGWDLEWHFNSALKLESTSDELIQQVDRLFIDGKTKTNGHLVLLAHDQVYADSADSAQLQDFIHKLKAKGEYNFETINKYPGLKN